MQERRPPLLTAEEQQALLNLLQNHDRIIARGLSEERWDWAWKGVAKIVAVVGALISGVSTLAALIFLVWDRWLGK